MLPPTQNAVPLDSAYLKRYLAVTTLEKSLLRLDAGRLQHGSPDRRLLTRPLAEFLRRAAHGDEAAGAQLLAHLRRRDGGVQCGVELGDDRLRRARRRDQGVDDGAVDLAEPLLLEGLHVGRRLRALGRGHAVGLELSVAEILCDGGQ